MRIFTTCLTAFLTFAVPSAARSNDMSAAEAFAKLRSLVGVWEGAFSNGRVHRVTYRLTAGDTVLVETWSLAPGRESMTMYHLDGDALIATHYCPAGNQPTLELRRDPKSAFVFQFRSATNLSRPATSHQHRFDIQLRDERHFWRSETYLENGEATTEAVSYTRVDNGASAGASRMQCGEVRCDIATEYGVREHFAAAQPSRFNCRKLPCQNAGTSRTPDSAPGFFMDVVYP